MRRHAGLLLLALLAAPPAHADPRAELKTAACAAIGRLTDATASAGPVLLPSYPTAELPALHQTAFVYDNALAVIALLACNDAPRAARIADALRIAATNDRFWHDGRIRNAYRAGSIVAGQPPPLPGWWDAKAARWDEDPYAAGTATGNVAWAALALIALDHAHASPPDHAAAESLMRWVATTTAVTSPVPGYAGGFFGEEPSPTRLLWASTEHNTDAAAAFHLLGMTSQATIAANFVAAMWDPKQGRFWLGTTGTAINHASSGIDAQLWPQIGVPSAPADWSHADAYVRGHHAVGGGYGFRDAPDGIWTEGTAQAALTLPDASLFALLLKQLAPDGLLYATASGTIRTGLALTPESVTDDFTYFHLPHLGATAWAVLAATGANPFRPK
jgi:hypothetical protein